jgi:hypothetical protein
VHVLRQVHEALRSDGLVLDIHPLGADFAVRAGERGLGFVDTSRFVRVLAAMEEGVQQVLTEGLFAGVQTLRRHVSERFDSAAEILEEADSWEHLRLPAAVRRRLRETEESPIELIDTITYRLLRANAASRGRDARGGLTPFACGSR